MPVSKSTYHDATDLASSVVREDTIEYGFIGTFQKLKYEYRPDITNRATLEANFREKFEDLNRLRLTDSEFARLLEEIVTPDGTCIRLEALRIKNSPTDQPVPFGTLYPEAYPGALTPIHISSNGTITLSSTDNENRTDILQIIPHNDTDNDGMPDDWEASFAQHLLNLGHPPEFWGLNYAELHSGNLNPATDYTGDGVGVLEVFNDQISFPPGDSDGDNDRDGIPNSEDAAPNDRLIRWAPSAGKFAFIPLKPSSELRPEGAPALQANPHGYSMRPALGEDATLTYHFGWESASPGRPYNGFYELGDELAQPLSFFVAGTVPLGDPPSNTESHSGILKYKDDEWEIYQGTLYSRNDTGVLTGTDHHFGDVIIRSGTGVKSFRKEAASQAYSIDYLGKSRDGRAYLAETTAGVGVRLLSLNKEGIVANHGNLPGSWEGSYSFASNGWFRIGSKLYTPDAVGKALPEHLAGANAWSVPDNGVALLAAGTLYLPNATGNSFTVPSSVQGRPIVGTTDGGVFLASDHSLWRNGEWLPLETWASEELRSRLTPEKILRIVESNSKGVTLVEFKDREPTSSSTSTYEILLPVEVEQQNYSSTQGIRFCRWLDAFQGVSFDNEFADKDRDRFRIRIPGIIPNLTKIKIKSTGLNGAVIDGSVVAKATDGDYEVEMKQENGAMVSTWILLVSDGDDDKGYNGKGTDDGKDDQTLLADFESKIIVTLPEFDNAEVEFTAQKPLGNITLDTVYLSPAGDVPQDIQVLIHRQVAKMQEIYRQIGVRVAWASIEGVGIPQSWLDAVPNPDPTKPDIEPINQLNDTESQSARTLIRNRQVPAKHIRIGYVNATLKIIDENFLEKHLLGFTFLGTDGILVSLGSPEARNKLGVTAHEVGHTFGLDHVDPEHLVMKHFMSWNNSRRDSKRFEEGNFNTIKNQEAFYVPMQ